MIKVDIKSKTYKMKNQKLKVLENIEFDIKGNGLVCILGPSGSGKTTLMNIIGALDSDFSGDVVINNKSLKKAKSKDLDSYRKNKIGFVFQHFNLLNQFSVYDNVALALTLSNIKNKNSRIKQLLSQVNMSDFARRKVNVLSGGQKQRVAIARALANDPDIILADEPTGSLDSKMGHDIMSQLKKLSKDKVVIVITHSEELANEFADTIIHLKDGKIEAYKEINSMVDALDNKKNETKSVMSIWSAFKHSVKTLLQKKGRTIATSIGMSIGVVGIALAFALSNGTSSIIKSQVADLLPANTLSVFPASKDASEMINISFSEEDIALFSYQDLLDISKMDESVLTVWPVLTNSMMEFYSEASLDEKEASSPSFSENSIYLSEGFQPYESISASITLGREPLNKSEILLSLTTAEILAGNDDIDNLIDKDLYVKFGPNTSIGMEDERNQILSYKIVGITSNNTLGNAAYQDLDFIIDNFEELYDIKKEEMSFFKLFVYLDYDLSSEEIKTVISKLNEKQDKFNFVGAADNIIDSAQTFMDVVRNVLIGFSSISVVVAILMIGIVIFISVIERIDEIGILRAIGARKKDVRNLFLFESMIIGLFAGVIGIFVSKGICNIINSAVSSLVKGHGLQIGNITVAMLDPKVALALILTCMFLALIAGVIPSLKAAKMDPIVALRRK